MIIPKSELDLAKMIHDQVEESLNLDYKRAESLTQLKSDLTKEVTKDVSAFANSAGGMIIYGISEGSGDSKHLPVAISPIDRNQFSKERLEQIINNIQPRIQGVEIFPIGLSSNKNDVAYVVVIPASDTAHQCTDKRYYRRYNFQAIMMEDYEIRDVMNRNRLPIISLQVKLHLFLSKSETIAPLMPNTGDNRDYPDFWWSVVAENSGGAIGHYIQGSIEFPAFSLKDYEAKNKKKVNLTITNFLRTSYGSGIYSKSSEPEYKRILPNCSLKVLSERAPSSIIKSEPFVVRWKIHCDNSPPQQGILESKNLTVEYNSKFKKLLVSNGSSLANLPFGEMIEIS